MPATLVSQKLPSKVPMMNCRVATTASPPTTATPTAAIKRRRGSGTRSSDDHGAHPSAQGQW